MALLAGVCSLVAGFEVPKAASGGDKRQKVVAAKALAADLMPVLSPSKASLASVSAVLKKHGVRTYAPPPVPPAEVANPSAPLRVATAVPAQRGGSVMQAGSKRTANTAALQVPVQASESRPGSRARTNLSNGGGFLGSLRGVFSDGLALPANFDFSALAAQSVSVPCIPSGWAVLGRPFPGQRTHFVWLFRLQGVHTDHGFQHDPSTAESGQVLSPHHPPSVRQRSFDMPPPPPRPNRGGMAALDCSMPQFGNHMGLGEYSSETVAHAQGGAGAVAYSGHLITAGALGMPVGL